MASNSISVSVNLNATPDTAESNYLPLQNLCKGGTVSVPGVYVGLIDKMPFGAVVNKGLTIKTGQTHVQRYGKALLEKIERGQIDPSFIITHRLPLEEAPAAYKTFRDKEDGCIKVVLKPSGR
jgi:threonine dehydrogenase-like Zn-dependent dehydrogenase